MKNLRSDGTRAAWRAAIAGLVAASAFLALGLAAGCGEASPQEPPALQLVDPSPDSQSSEGYAQERASSGQATSISADTAGLPEIGQKIVKTGALEVTVERNGYGELREKVHALADSSGGYLQGESSSQDGQGLTHGTVTVRIPADQFDAAFAAIAGFGKAGKTNVKTSDMTQEYVDLQSRLRHLQAEEVFYLGLIDKAQTVSDMISISDRLSEIQQQKETAMGRQSYLDNQVAYATITASINESAEGEAAGGFWSSVSSAFRSFGRAGKYLGLGILYALPYLLVAGAAGLAFWGFKRKRRTA